MTEPSTDQFGIPLSSLRLLVSPLRLMSAALWGIVQHRAVKHYGLLEDFITAVQDNIPGLLSHSERLHIFLGLRAKMVLEMCNRDDMSCKQHIESLLIKMEDLIMLQEDETSQSKMKASLCDFTKLVHSMLEDPLERDLFYQKPLSSEFEFTFDSNLQMLVGKLLVTLENFLPVPSLDQTSLWLGLCPSVLKDCEDILHHPEPLSNLLQQHKHKSTFSTGLYSNDYFPSFYDSAAQQVERSTIQYRGTDTKGDATDGTEDCAPSVEVTLSFDDDLCSQTFESFHLLRKHSVSGCSGDSYEDDTIQLNFNSIANILSVKNDSKPNMDSENIVCLLCRQVYTHKTLLEHQRVCVVRYEQEKRTAAQSLISPLKSRSSPISKERSKRSTQRKTCSKCGETFTCCEEFTSHMKVHSEECRIDLNNYEHNFHQENVYKENKTLLDNDLTETNDTPKEYKECVVRLRRLPRCRDTTTDNSNVDSSEEFGQNLDEHQNVNQCYILIEPCNINANVTGNNAKTNPVLQIGESENTSTKSRSLKCTLCEQTFSNILLLKRHYFALHRVKGSYPCPSCKRRFVRLCDMVKHHQNKRLFQCDTCQWCFTKLNFCKVHKIRLNTCATPNVYETCGQRCLNAGVLKHDQKAHTLKRESTVCTICNKKFSTKYCLRLHMNRHTGGFSCSICNKVFHQKTFLKRHMDRHNGEEPYLCEVCGKGFPTPATLNVHMVKHKDERPFNCDQCDKSFKRERVLRVHISTMHLNLREYVCPVCSKAYKYSGSLKEHMIKHTGVYPHKCFLCGKSFERLTYLKKHQEKKCLYISL